MPQEMENKSQDVLNAIGAKLQAERKRQELSTSDIASRLRIMESHIRNIEAGELDGLPTFTYVIGYVRSYSGMLGMDSAALCAELKASLDKTENNPDLNFTDGQIHARTGGGRVALAALILGFLSYGGWYALSTDNIDQSSSASGEIASIVVPTTQVVEPEFVAVAPRAATPDVPSLDVPSPDAPTLALDEPTAVAQADVAPSDAAPELLVAETDASAPASDLTNTPLTIAPIEPVQTAEQLDNADTLKKTTKVTDAQAVNRVPAREITLQAKASSWVEVTRADGSAVTARLMRIGDTYVVPSGEDLYLTTGNAGGLNLTLGKDAPILLGAWGETLRELPLDETIIKERY